MDIITTAANTIDLTPICEAIIALLAAVITMYLIPWIKSKTNEQQQAYIHAAVKVAVYAAEKFYGAGNGDMKLAYAQRILEDNYSIKLDAHKLGAAVNAAIKEMEQAEPPILMTGELDTAVEPEGGEEEETPQRQEESLSEV
jgi:hypothetical protein